MDIKLEHIEFKKDEIPVSKKVDIDGKLYTIELQYNEVANFYTTIVYDENEKVLISTKLVNMGNIFAFKHNEVPERMFMPLNINDLTSDVPESIRVDYENFEEKIKLYLI